MKKKILSVRLAAIFAVLLAFFALGVTAMAEETTFEITLWNSTAERASSVKAVGSAVVLDPQADDYEKLLALFTDNKWIAKDTVFANTAYTFTEADLALSTVEFFNKYFPGQTKVDLCKAAKMDVIVNSSAPTTYYAPIGRSVEGVVHEYERSILRNPEYQREWIYTDATTPDGGEIYGKSISADEFTLEFRDTRMCNLDWYKDLDKDLDSYMDALTTSAYKIFGDVCKAGRDETLLGNSWIVKGTIFAGHNAEAFVSFSEADFSKTVMQVFQDKFGNYLREYLGGFSITLDKASDVRIVDKEGEEIDGYAVVGAPVLGDDGVLKAAGVSQNPEGYVWAYGNAGRGLTDEVTAETTVENVTLTLFRVAVKLNFRIGDHSFAIFMNGEESVENMLAYHAEHCETCHGSGIENYEYYQDTDDDGRGDGERLGMNIKTFEELANMNDTTWGLKSVPVTLNVGSTSETYYLGYHQKFSELELGRLFENVNLWFTDPLLLKPGTLSVEEATELSPDATGADLVGLKNEYWVGQMVSFHGFGESVVVYAATGQNVKDIYLANDGVGDEDRSALLAPIKRAEPEGTDHVWYCSGSSHGSSVIRGDNCYPVTEKTVSVYRGDELIFGPEKYPSDTSIGFDIAYEENLGDLVFGDVVHDQLSTDTLDVLSTDETIVLHTVIDVEFKFPSLEDDMDEYVNSGKTLSEVIAYFEASLEELIDDAFSEENAEKYRKRLAALRSTSGWAASVNGQFVTNDKGELVPATKLPTESEVVFYPLNTITFKANGKVVDTLYYVGGSKPEGFREPSVPAKAGYYAKWESYSFDDAKNIVVEAVYTAKTYRVQFDANGGEGYMSSQVHSWDSKRALTINSFTRDGYRFIGWNTKADGSGTSFADGETVSNLSLVGGALLYAQWEKVILPPKVFTVTFMANGAFVDSVSFTEGDPALSYEPEIPERIGYTGAWEAYTLGSADITVQAVYSVNHYVIAFNSNGGDGSMGNLVATYDDFATLPENVFTNLERKFLGWNTKADGSGASFEDGAQVINLTSEGLITLFALWGEEDSATESTSESTTAETTTAEIPAEKNNTGLIIGLCVAAAIAIAGGVAGYLTYQKKKNS